MDRAEQTGLGLSVGGHLALVAILSLGWFAATKPIMPQTQPIDVQIVDKVGLIDAVPEPAPAPPAARVAPEVGPPDEAPTAPPVSVPAPPTAVAPPKPAMVAKPQPAKPAPAKPAPAKPATVKPVTSPADARPRRRPGLDRSLIAGLTDAPGVATAKPNPSTSAKPRAAAGPAVEASLAREVLRQLKPFWHAPTGADAELLRTELSISLKSDGSVADVRALGTKGVTDSNRGQVRLHQEAAIKAVRLAAPFSLPAEFYDAWKLLEPVGFDKRLSQ